MIAPGKKVVVALGGNALVRPGEDPTLATQSQNVGQAMQALLPLVENDNKIVITHGNGFQVGNILLRVEEAMGKAYGIPLEVCVAESQGEIGYLIEQALQNVLVEAGIRLPVVSVLTQVVVNEKDPAFQNPTKPIGPAYTRQQADALREQGFQLVREQGRGWRKVVPSPKPIEIDDVDVLDWLLRKPVIVVAAGGGGVPVVRKRGKRLQGVAAVVDKDHASTTLALGLRAPHLVILTGEPVVYRNYLRSDQEPLPQLSIAEAEKLHLEGQFPAGSMGPKIEAAIDFLRGGGKTVTITDAEHLREALHGTAGTTMTRTTRTKPTSGGRS